MQPVPEMDPDDPEDTDLFVEPRIFEPPVPTTVDPMADNPLPANPLQPPVVDPIA